MNSILEHWLCSPWWIRLGAFSCLVMVPVFLLWQLWGRPVMQQSGKLQVRYQQQIQHYKAALLTLSQTESQRKMEEEIARLQQLLEPVGAPHFSLQALLETAGGDLRLWQPAKGGGELILLLSWPQLQKVLFWLATLPPGVTLPRFSLKRQRERLYFHLLLAFGDEA